MAIWNDQIEEAMAIDQARKGDPELLARIAARQRKAKVESLKKRYEQGMDIGTSPAQIAAAMVKKQITVARPIRTVMEHLLRNIRAARN